MNLDKKRAGAVGVDKRHEKPKPESSGGLRQEGRSRTKKTTRQSVRRSLLEVSANGLLDQFRQNLSPAWWEHYQELISRRQEESLSREELSELLALTDTLEEINVWRARGLGCIAAALGVSMEELVDSAGIQPRLVG